MKPVKTLATLSSEMIRQNWPTYEKDVDKSSHLYDVLWTKLYEKQDLTWNDPDVVMLRTFIDGDDRQMIVSVSSNRRATLHHLCDKLGLHHQSQTRKRKRVLVISKPPVWKWEFTEGLPESRWEESRQGRREESKRRMARMACDWCGGPSPGGMVLVSVYIPGRACEDCLETQSDGEGGLLGNHKWEPPEWYYE